MHEVYCSPRRTADTDARFSSSGITDNLFSKVVALGIAAQCRLQ